MVLTCGIKYPLQPNALLKRTLPPLFSVLLSTPFTKMPLVVVSRTRHCTCKLDGIRHENLITKMTGLNLIKSSCCKNLDICEHPLEVPESNHNEWDECSQVLFNEIRKTHDVNLILGKTMIHSFNLNYIIQMRQMIGLPRGL